MADDDYATRRNRRTRTAIKDGITGSTKDAPPDREPQTGPQGISTAPVTAVRFASITSIYELS